MELDTGCFGDGCSNYKVDGFCDFGGVNCENREFLDDEGEGSDNINDSLPQDPFNMDNQRIGEVSFVVTTTVRIHQVAGLQKIDGNCELVEMDTGEGLDGDHCLIDDKGEEITGYGYEKYCTLRDTTMNDHCNTDGADFSDALLLSLGYLGLGDLLAVERVCKSLRDAVRGDPLLWRSIEIDHPFTTKITDDILIKLTNRAQGHLHSLCLRFCSKITDIGLKHVLERNPSLKKLSVPGCVRLTVDGILSNLKVFNSAGKPGLKYLGINGMFGVTNQHFEEFKLLIGSDNGKLPTTRKPRFFGGGRLCANSDEDPAMDIEVCPKCQQLGLVYDCPRESCQKKQSATPICRACTLCVKRCIDCGCCIGNRDFKEIFCLEWLCLDCWIERQRLDCQEREQNMTFLPKATVLHKQESYHFYLCG